MALYFNHNRIINCTIDDLSDFLEELVSMKELARENGEDILFYENLWDINLEETTLKNFLFNHNNIDYVKVFIDCIMNGPYYSLNDNLNVELKNEYLKGFSYSLLSNCFLCKQDKILSLKNENELIKDKYEFLDDESFILNNFIGESNFKKYIDESMHFNNIDDVFKMLEMKGIVILNDAYKSAKKHDFKGKLDEIYYSILCLKEKELPMLISGMNDEKRIEKMLTEYHITLSKDSEETLNVERYKKEREFIVPSIGKIVFSWHIKLQNGHTRIHYFTDKENGVVYIGHCGKHLTTVNYNS